MRVRVEEHIDDLARDCARIPAKVAVRGAKVVQKNVKQGKRLAQRFAREKSGPHGSNYHKRITSEMTGPLTGEYGPHDPVAGNAVGGGWRNGPPNTDLPRSADIQGPRFAKDAAKATEVFW